LLGIGELYNIFKISFVLHLCRFEQHFIICIWPCEKSVQDLAPKTLFSIRGTAGLLRPAESYAQIRCSETAADLRLIVCGPS
jgi:hypothetical protein